MKKYIWSYTVWIAFTSAVYIFIYLNTPLKDYGIAWMSFVSLPIFFIAGAPVKEVQNFICSVIAGILWGLVYLWFLNLCLSFGCSIPLANALDFLIPTIPCVGLTLTVLSKTWVNKVPMIFCGLAMTFSQGGKNPVIIGITLCAGLLLGCVYSIGGSWLENKFLTEET